MEMLSIHLDRSIDTPLYEQIYMYIKQEIINSHLAYGEKLPSKRKLSEFLEVSQNTIETAFDQLVAEGYIESRPRKGYFVLAQGDLEYIYQAKNTTYAENTSTDEINYDFYPSRIDTEAFPFDQWKKYTKQMIDKQHHQLLLLGNAQGDVELREEIANYLYHARGIRCDRDSIIVGAGVEILLQQLISLFPKETLFGIEDPGYQLILHIVKHFGHQAFPLEMDDQGIIMKRLEEADPTLIYVTPSHHFPYGSVLSINRRNQLLQWAEDDQQRYIIEDDYDSEFRYTGKTIPPLKSMDANDRVIYLGSFSKSLIPSLRISYMILPKQLLNLFNHKLSFYHSTVSRIDQQVLAQFMRNGDFEKHLNRMRKIYRRKLELVLELIKPYHPTIRFIGEQSGLHIVCEVRNGKTEQEIINNAKKAKLKVYPITAYTATDWLTEHPQFIIGFAGIPYRHLQDAVESFLDICL
ncbi:transcriptional regulator (GntR family) [Oceanobacillus iheyensis HTE831]|uniref:Transcriptional regulator (GntR family) n=1 Tax=Oceanobacillus iheyensis (strain DSM 14371 / CIP 107618 / JCM 11309 / KCTC 3954 / HTE831) TaxID=221109 RepID=Q8EN02_OCEIH|nr:PLP-dependent aminotransferase family protein [Oceanobacillus iheyensis]BAC14644.1 transcriptional regulator (GntR family) [Oceanobacillus iheyensis HTE831]